MTVYIVDSTSLKSDSCSICTTLNKQNLYIYIILPRQQDNTYLSETKVEKVLLSLCAKAKEQENYKLSKLEIPAHSVDV